MWWLIYCLDLFPSSSLFSKGLNFCNEQCHIFLKWSIINVVWLYFSSVDALLLFTSVWMHIFIHCIYAIILYIYAFAINVVEIINYPHSINFLHGQNVYYWAFLSLYNLFSLVTQFLNRNGIECNDLEELFIKDQSLSNESEYFGFGFFTFFLKNINLNPFYSNLS